MTIMIIIGLVFDFEFSFIKINSQSPIVLIQSLVSISILGTSILSIIVNSLNLEMFGLRIKEILTIGNSSNDYENLISINLQFVLIGYALYMFDFLNALSMHFLYVVFFLMRFSKFTWKVITDDVEAYKVIEFGLIEIELISEKKSQPKDNETINRYLASFSRSYLDRIRKFGVNSEPFEINLIARLINQFQDENEKRMFLERFIRSAIVELSRDIGTVTIISSILSRFKEVGVDDSTYLRIANNVLVQHVREARYFTLETLKVGGYIEFFSSINSIKYVSQDIRSQLIYESFKSIHLNQSNYLSKLGIYESILDMTFTPLTRNDQISNEVISTIIGVFKDFILLNQDKDERVALYRLFTKQIDIKHRYRLTSKREDLNNIIGLTFFMLYSFGFNETALTDVFSEQLKKLIDIPYSEIDSKGDHFKQLISDNLFDIIDILTITLLDENDYTMEYFPDYLHLKSSTINEFNIVTFIFMLVILSKYTDFIFEKVFEIEKYKNNRFKYSILNHAMSFYDLQKCEFSDEFVEEFNIFSSWFKTKKEISADDFHDMFVKINDLLIQSLSDSNTIKSVQPQNYLRVIDSLRMLNKNNGFINIEDLKNEYRFCKTIHAFNYFAKKENNKVEDIAESTYRSILRTTYDYLFEKTDLVIKNSSSFQSYIHVNNLDATNSRILLSKKNKASKLELISTPTFNVDLVFKKSDFKFSIRNIEIQFEEPNEQQALNYMETFRTSVNYFRIGNGFFDTESAIKYAKRNFWIINLRFDFCTDFVQGSGFRIEEI